MMNSCNRERENRDRIIELSIEISEEHERGKISGNWSGWKIGQVTEIGWKWWLAAADKYEWPTRYIYIHIHIRVYTNRSRYINYVACSIKIDLRLIGNARAHATRFLACSVSTDFQPRYRASRKRAGDANDAHRGGQSDDERADADETCSNNKLLSPTILRLFLRYDRCY